MEQHDIHDLIAHPEKLDGNTLLFLKELVVRYPYFQTAWILYLKNLFILGKPEFKDELRKGALFVADLSVLFYYIEGERFLIKKHVSEAKTVTDSASDRTLDLIDRFLSELPENETPSKTIPEVTVPMEMPSDYTSVLLSEVTEEEKDASPLHGHELIDQFIENSVLGGTEASDKLDDNKLNNENENGGTESEGNLAEEMNPTDEAEPVSDNPVEEETEENYFTETLAKIYVRQQRYEKALEIIKKLNLKYPKKNAYFADQIRFLEKLIINAKSK